MYMNKLNIPKFYCNLESSDIYSNYIEYYTTLCSNYNFISRRINKNMFGMELFKYEKKST
jgi:hypothetical protein